MSFRGFEFGPKPDFGMHVVGRTTFQVITFDVPSVRSICFGHRKNRRLRQRCILETGEHGGRTAGAEDCGGSSVGAAQPPADTRNSQLHSNGNPWMVGKNRFVVKIKLINPRVLLRDAENTPDFWF